MGICLVVNVAVIHCSYSLFLIFHTFLYSGDWGWIYFKPFHVVQSYMPSPLIIYDLFFLVSYYICRTTLWYRHVISSISRHSIDDVFNWCLNWTSWLGLYHCRNTAYGNCNWIDVPTISNHTVVIGDSDYKKTYPVPYRLSEAGS